MVDTVKGALNGSESALNGSQIEKNVYFRNDENMKSFFKHRRKINLLQLRFSDRQD